MEVFAFQQSGTAKCFKSNMVASGGADVHVMPIPLDATLIGLKSTIQGIIAGGGTELCNAEDICLGI